MTSNLTLWIVTIVGSLAAALSACGSHVLRDFSRRQLEIYSRRLRRRDRFGEILTGHDQLAVVADTAWVLSTTMGLLALATLLARLELVSESAATGRLAGIVAACLLLAVAAFHWIPRAILRFWSAPFLFHTWTLWKVLAAFLYPITWIGTKFESLAGRLGGLRMEEPDDEEAFEDEIRTMVTAGQREGLLEPDAREMIEGVIELSDREVADIMTPRSHVDALNVDLPWPEVLRFVVDVGRTRIPVYEGNLDNIIGILYAKDLLIEFSKESPEQRTPLRRLLRDAWLVTTTKAVDDMLRDFLDTRNHMAIVVDEYRSVAGVVTIEDALEEIVGEINDESDLDEEDEIRLLDEYTAEAVGYAHLEEINERLGLNLPEPEELDTIGGLVIRLMNTIPGEGVSVNCGNVKITVLKASRRSVDLVRLETHAEPPKDTGEEEDQPFQQSRQA